MHHKELSGAETILLALLVATGIGAAGGCRARCLDSQAIQSVFDAAWQNDVRSMRDLLERDASLAAATGCGSLQSGSTSVLSARMSGLSSPLFVAARQGHAEIVKLLVDRGAPVDAAGGSGETPLHLAARHDHDAAVKVLIAAHATIDARSIFKMTPLDYAASNGSFASAKLLVSAGADVNCRDVDGTTPLHSAAAGGHADVVRLLLEHGANIEARTDDGTTALQSAVVGRHNDVVALLASKGADVNRGNNSTTALNLAILTGGADAVAQLIRQGADVNARSAHGESPLQAVIHERRRRDEIDDQLRLRDQEKMRLLIDAGADIRMRGENGSTPLHLAARRDRDDLAALLIARGTDVNARDASQLTPLHYAANYAGPDGYTSVVEVLLKNGAEVNAETKDRRTALDLAWSNDAMKSVLRGHGGHIAGYPR